MTPCHRFTVLMVVNGRVERYSETSDYSVALDTIARVRRCFPGREVYLRDVTKAIADAEAAARLYQITEVLDRVTAEAVS